MILSAPLRRCATVMLALMPCGCSQPAGVPSQEALVVSTADLVAKLDALPKEGPRSVAGMFMRVSAMSLPEYYDYLLTTAPNMTVRIDSMTIPNPRLTLIKYASQFRDMDAVFSTVGQLWNAALFKPNIDITQAQLRAALSVAGGASELSLEGSCDSFFMQGQQAAVPLSGVGGAGNGFAANLGLRSHASARRIIAARQAQNRQGTNAAAGTNPTATLLGNAQGLPSSSVDDMDEPQSEPYGFVTPRRESPGQQILALRAQGYSSEEIQDMLPGLWRASSASSSGASSSGASSSGSDSDTDSVLTQFSCLRVKTKPGG